MASRLVRLFRALELLSRPEGATIAELAERLEVDRRSAYRHRDEIEELGIPLIEEREPGAKEKRWRIMDRYVRKLPNLTVPSLDLSLREIVALYLLKGQTRLFKETEVQGRIDSAFGKISQLVPQKLAGHLDEIGSIFIPISKCRKEYKGKEEVIDHCVDAILQKKTCLVTYHSFSDDRVKHFKIDPLCFFENNGGLYLFVNTTTFGEIRILAVERIQELKPTEADFEYPAGFNPAELLNSAFDIVYDDPIHVKVWFAASQSRYIKERTWGREQRITDLPDGSLVLEMFTSGWWDVKRWVLSHGEEAIVLEPPALRRAIVAELERALGEYGSRTGKARRRS